MYQAVEKCVTAQLELESSAFESCNDKDIVKHIDNVPAIISNWLFTNSTWKYYNVDLVYT